MKGKKTGMKLSDLDLRVLRLVRDHPSIYGYQFKQHGISAGSIFPTVKNLLDRGVIRREISTNAESLKLGGVPKHCFLTEKGAAYLDWVESEPELP